MQLFILEKIKIGDFLLILLKKTESL